MAQKFRPYLTAAQLHYFLDLCHNDTRESTLHLRLATIKELKVFLAKYELGAVNPAYEGKGRLTIADRLGLDTTDPIQRREAAYVTWSANPHLCTPEEISLAALYRYENDLMSPDEEAAYENSI